MFLLEREVKKTFIVIFCNHQAALCETLLKDVVVFVVWQQQNEDFDDDDDDDDDDAFDDRE